MRRTRLRRSLLSSRSVAVFTQDVEKTLHRVRVDPRAATIEGEDEHAYVTPLRRADRMIFSGVAGISRRS